MKRIFACIVSLMTALVMCFAFVACDGRPSGVVPDGDPGGNTPAPTPTPTPDGGKDGMAAKALNAVRELFDESGFKGEVGYKLSSDGIKASNGVIEQTVAAEKRGNVLRASYTTSDGEKDVLFDLDTGYEYNVKEVDGALEVLRADSVLPAGLYGYAQTMIGELVPDGDVTADDELIEYDATTKTVSFHADGAEKINDMLEPLYTAYKSGSVIDLLDGYIEYFSDGAYTFSHTTAVGVISIYDLIYGYIGTFKDMDIGTVLETAKSMGLDIQAMLEQNGIDVLATLAQYGVDITEEQLLARKLGQVMVGAYNALGRILGGANTPSSAQDGEQTPSGGTDEMLSMILSAALKGAFVDDADGSTAEKAFADVVEMLDALKVKALIDNLSEQDPELVAFIANGVELKKLTTDVSVKLDDSDKLSELKFEFVLAHAYTGDVAADFSFLADNNYTAEFTVTVTEHMASSQAFEYTFGDGYSINAYSAGAIVYGEITDDITVFVELGALDVNASVTGVYKVDADRTMIELQCGDKVTYDAATSVITIKADFYNEFLATATSGEKLSVELSIDPALSSAPIYVGVEYLPDDPQALLEYLAEKLKSIYPPDGGEPPIVTDPDQGGEIAYVA